ncbi:hypothetical protein [Neptuniibacter sp. QD37_11]|uniref:hypothetical protein n=1 Tax=Neptuniibacter sp. QD37_11 TaxID=3398209 RepID=UPI0039F54D02
MRGQMIDKGTYGILVTVREGMMSKEGRTVNFRIIHPSLGHMFSSVRSDHTLELPYAEDGVQSKLGTQPAQVQMNLPGRTLSMAEFEVYQNCMNGVRDAINQYQARVTGYVENGTWKHELNNIRLALADDPKLEVTPYITMPYVLEFFRLCPDLNDQLGNHSAHDMIGRTLVELSYFHACVKQMGEVLVAEDAGDENAYKTWFEALSSDHKAILQFLDEYPATQRMNRKTLQAHLQRYCDDYFNAMAQEEA